MVPGPQKKKKELTSDLHVIIDKSLHKEIKKLAKETGFPTSQMVRILFVQALKNRDELPIWGMAR